MDMSNEFYFREQKISYRWKWYDNNTFIFEFGDGEFTDSDSEYFIHFEYHVEDREWIIEIWWQDDNININELDKFDADEYITEKEIKEVKKFAKQFMD